MAGCVDGESAIGVVPAQDGGETMGNYYSKGGTVRCQGGGRQRRQRPE
jgi:hypothetical protein